MTDRIELLGLAQLLLQRDAFRHVAADEEIALLQLEPRPAQGERHDAVVTVHIAAVEVSRGAALARRPYFLAGPLKVARMHERGTVAADHLLRTITEDRLGARADVDDGALAVDDQDEVERARKQPPTLDDLGLQRHRFFTHLASHTIKGAGQCADLAAGPGRQAQRLAAPEAVDRRRHLGETPGQGARQHDGQQDGADRCHQDRRHGGVAHGGQRRGEIRVRHRLDDE